MNFLFTLLSESHVSIPAAQKNQDLISWWFPSVWNLPCVHPSWIRTWTSVPLPSLRGANLANKLKVGMFACNTLRLTRAHCQDVIPWLRWTCRPCIIPRVWKVISCMKYETNSRKTAGWLEIGNAFEIWMQTLFSFCSIAPICQHCGDIFFCSFLNYGSY